MSKQNQIAVVGLGVMGAALAKNFVSRDFKIAVFNRTHATAEKLQQETDGKATAYSDLKELVASLEKPRKIFFMLPAGPIVDDHIEILKDLLEKDDIIMDGGNSFFQDTRRRSKYCKELGLAYFGVGVSGGEQGALLGPSIMPGGDEKGYAAISPFLDAISAKHNGEPCCAYMGQDGAGHYVKMVHNGIEYADMQLIAEVYLYFKNICGKTNQEIASILEAWNKTEVKSYLIEISSIVLREKDPETSGDLVDYIQDAASNKGTGKWTSIESFELSVDVSMITTSLQCRIVSNLDKERTAVGSYLAGVPTLADVSIPMTEEEVRNAYYLAKVVAYAQGFAMMKEAGKAYGWTLDLEKVASIFRAGCIIQADFLDVIMKMYKSQADLDNLLLHDEMKAIVSKTMANLRVFHLNTTAKAVPTPTIAAALMYLDQLHAPLLGANLIQGQRDYFGAHTFLRTDKEGVFHHDWN